MDMKEKIRHSMLWAAYGDALGFITELCDKSTLAYRTGGQSNITELIPWKRKIGGRYGISWRLPTGCYSDDTQLRLAVCRAIRGDGYFDVEPFAKVELPVFLSYALGAGTGTKTAAESLKKKSVHWNTNFYDTKYGKYIMGGGNGAAMRIQPHVWAAAPEVTQQEILRSVLRDAVVTHGHPVALVGAAFHALLLRETMNVGHTTPPSAWKDILSQAAQLPEVASADEDLSLLWLPEWERRTSSSFADGVNEAIKEAMLDLERLVAALPAAGESPDRHDAYIQALKSINALDKSCRGSGTKTALLAAYVAELFSDSPAAGLNACANAIGSDTDTIATMAGALIGAVSESAPPQKVADQDYILFQADRMAAIRNGETPTTHIYPDLLSWTPPKNNLDTVGVHDKSLILRGFGEVQPTGETIEQKGQYLTIWQQCQTSFGQTLLLRRREKPSKATKSDLPCSVLASNNREAGKHDKKTVQTTEGNRNQELDLTAHQPPSGTGPLTVDGASDLAIKSGFDAKTTGKALLSLAEQENGVEKAIGFAAIVAKAKGYRMRRDRGERV